MSERPVDVRGPGCPRTWMSIRPGCPGTWMSGDLDVWDLYVRDLDVRDLDVCGSGGNIGENSCLLHKTNKCVINSRQPDSGLKHIHVLALDRLLVPLDKKTP